MDIKETKFTAHPEKGQVSAILLRPAGAKALISLGHGAGAGMRHANMENIALALARRNIASFRYQFPYMERGGGKDSQAVSLSTVRQAALTARKLEPDLPLLAGGHSFGGRMTSLAAAETPLEGVKGLIFFSFPLHAPGKASNKRAEHLPDITVPVLFLSGTRDTFMTPELFQPILDQLGERATMHLLDTADHGYKTLKRTRISQEDVFDEMARVVDGWIEKK